MEEKNEVKYTQIKLNVGSIEEASVEPAPKVEEPKEAVDTRLDDPETIPMDIKENRSEIPLGDDVTLVSPDETIFTHVAESVNDGHAGSGYASEWHDTKSDSEDSFEVNDAYASTAHANRSFMETFGLTGTGALKTVTDKDIYSAEQETESDESEENSYEYKERLQNSEIKRMYDYAVGSIGKKLIFSIIFSVLLFFVENITLFIKEPTGILNVGEHPYLHLGASLLLLVLCSICAYEQIYHGFKSISTKDYLPESVSVIALIVSLIHSVSALLFTSFGYPAPRTFNFVTGAILIGTVLFSFVNVVREEYGFSAVSAKDAKFILEKVHEGNAEAEYDTFTTTTNGEFNGQIARVGKTGFVKRYFYNTNSIVNIGRFMSIYYLIVLLLPIVFAVITLFRGGDISNLTTYWSVGALLLLPVGVLCSYSVPFYIGNKRLYEDGVAIIGEDAVKEYANIDVVAVNDTTAFPPQNVKIQYFNVYNDFTIERVLYYAANGFSVVGGPLADVFDAAVNESVAKNRKVKFICAGRNYLRVNVDTDRVIFADKFGMTSQGIEVGNEREDKDDISIMYIAVNNILAAKLYIRYEIDEEFLRIARLLNKNETGIGIRTFDPNLNNDLLKKLSGFKKRDLRIIKLSSANEVIQVTEQSDGKIVSKGRSRSLIKAIPVCKKILSTRKVIRAISIVSSLVGAVLMALWIFGTLNFAYSAHLVGYHLVFTLIMMLVSAVSMPKLK